MKILIAIMFAALVASNIGWYLKTEKMEKVAQERLSYQIRQLDKFYYGFCLEAKDAGLGSEDYKRLCGDV